jgi:hypothetical protein
MPSETNSLPAEVSTHIVIRVHHWVDTSAGRLLVPEGIIRQVVSVSVLTLCIIYLRVYHWIDISASRLLVPEGIIRSVVSVSVLTLCIIFLRVYHWVDTSAGRLLLPECIIRPVVSVSVLTLCIIYLRVYHWVGGIDPVINTQISNTQCQYRNTDYWADDALGDQ